MQEAYLEPSLAINYICNKNPSPLSDRVYLNTPLIFKARLHETRSELKPV